MLTRNSERHPTRDRGQLAALYKQFEDSKTRVSRNRAAWKLVSLILHAKTPFASLTISAMPRRNYTRYEGAIIELFRLGYDFTSNARWPPIGSDNAEYLLYTIGFNERLEPTLFAGVLWALKNRTVDWAYQIWKAEREGYSDKLNLVLTKASLLHLKDQVVFEDGEYLDLEAALGGGLRTK
jgi:hypothetical protein